MADKTLSNKEKVAVLLLNLGSKAAGDILGSFGETEIAEISEIIGKMKTVDDETSVRVLDEFTNSYDSWSKSKEIIDVIKDHRPSIIPFVYFKSLSNEEITSIITGEHPQLVALVLSHLDAQQSAEIVGAMPEDERADVINRMITASPPPIQVIKQIDERLEAKVHSLGGRLDTPDERKFRAIAEILNRTDTATERTIMQRIREEDPRVAEEIKALMFVFEDISEVDDKALMRVLGEIKIATIALALKTASEEVRRKIFANMSKRMGEMVKEELELLGPRPLAEVEGAQKEIVDSLSRLEAQGEVIRTQGRDAGPMV
ncbi:MAG: flagellar motor switch protein FliG [Planctomycetota bacterium]|jgi:flagellar motor switch protein FliG